MITNLYSATYKNAVADDLKALLPDQFKKQTGSSETETNVPALIEAFNYPNQEIENAIFGLLETFLLSGLTAYTTKLISDLTGSPNLTDYELLQYLVAGHCAARSSSGTASDVAQAFKMVIASDDAATYEGRQALWGEANVMPTSDLYTDEEVAAFCNAIMQEAVAAGVRWDGIGINQYGLMLDISELSEDNIEGDYLGDYYTA